LKRAAALVKRQENVENAVKRENGEKREEEEAPPPFEAKPALHDANRSSSNSCGRPPTVGVPGRLFPRRLLDRRRGVLAPSPPPPPLLVAVV
jgi:hypothetical protein